MGWDGKKLTLVSALLILMCSFTLGEVFATGGVTNTSYSSQKYAPTAETIDATGGTLYEFNVSVTEPTYRWTGLWGNISGAMSLFDSSGANSFYSWGSLTDGSVLYATTNSSGLDTSAFSTTDDAALKSANAAYGYIDTVKDSINNTYTVGTPFQSPSMGSSVNVMSTTVGSWTNYAMVNGGGSISSTDDIMWAVDILQAQSGFDGSKMDFEMLIPENEEAGDGEGAATTYYLWAELA